MPKLFAQSSEPDKNITFNQTKRKIIAPLTIAGLLSGILTSLLFPITPAGLYNFLPGLLFGIAISVFFVNYRKQKIDSKIIGFIAISALAYYAAVTATLSTPFHVNSDPLSGSIDPTIFLSGGLVGALILSLGIKYLLIPIKNSQAIFLTIAGSLLGMFGWLLGTFIYPTDPASNPGGSPASYYSLYILWQTGIALAFAICLKLNEKRFSPKNNPQPSSSTINHNKLVTGILVGLGIILLLYFVLKPIVQSHQSAVCTEQATAQDNRADLVGSDAYCYNKCNSEVVPGGFSLPNGEDIGECQQECTNNSELYDTLYRHCTGEIHKSATIIGNTVIYQP